MSENVVNFSKRRELKQDRDFVLNYSLKVRSMGSNELQTEIDQLISALAPKNKASKYIFLKGQILLSELETRFDHQASFPNPISSLVSEFRQKLNGMQVLPQ